MSPRLELIPNPASEPASAADFTAAMSAFAAGVAIVTCRVEGRPWGTTVTALTSVSTNPPTILVSIGAEATAARAIAADGRFGVSLLGVEHLHVAQYASTPGAPKFLEAFAEPGAPRDGSPAVAGALAHLDCELSEEIRVADHTVFIGTVRHARAADAGSPLLYFRRAYRALADSRPARAAAGRSARWLSS
jgi:flavin reductase (DIM6/NTAB) family NADH-FMN oxidoreductase RutF